MINDIKIQFLGGSDEVGSLAMVLETGGNKFLFEYGMTPCKPPEFPLPAPHVDLTLLTHSHLDHSGMIPSLCSEGEQKILATEITSLISTLLFKDSVKIAKSEGYAPPYAMKDIKETENSFIGVEPKEKKLIGYNHEIRIHSAGHIPGSLMYELTGSRRLLFTGDFNTKDTRLVKGTKPVKCDVLFMEGTYAGRDHPKKRDELEKEFLDKVEEVVGRGGVVVLPAFAVARSQEIALILRQSGFNIWFDGMGRKVSDLFLKYPKYLRSSENLKKAMNNMNIVRSDNGRRKALESDVIITSSGMMDGGPVLNYIYKLRNKSKSAVILTGYQVEGTNSRLLVDKGKLDFFGVIENVYCEVQYYDFSAHSGHSELIEFAKECNPEKIVLFHSDNRKALEISLSDFAEVYTPYDGEIIEL
jgi:putative mRNA 3-end processing factor